MHRHLALPVFAVLLFSGCSLPTTLSPGPEDPSGDRAVFEEARARWDAAGIDNYAFTFRESCFCPPEFLGPFRITVEDGAVVSAEQNGRPATEQRTYPTIDALFEIIADAFDQDAETISLSYDAVLGVPLGGYIDYDALIADEEFSFEVSRFTR